jgi:hypothetical protein
VEENCRDARGMFPRCPVITRDKGGVTRYVTYLEGFFGPSLSFVVVHADSDMYKCCTFSMFGNEFLGSLNEYIYIQI